MCLNGTTDERATAQNNRDRATASSKDLCSKFKLVALLLQQC